MSDRIDLDWQFTQQWPGDETMTGYVPRVGEHVYCYRPSDGKTQCGVVDDNRCGLFLTRCDGARVVMTAALWRVWRMPHGGSRSPVLPAAGVEA